MGKQRIAILAVLVASGLWSADTTKPAAPVQTPNQTAISDGDMKAVVDTIQSFSGLLNNLDAAASSLDESDGPTADAKTDIPQPGKPGRPLKGSIAIITAGAAAGASIGAATKKGTQAIVIGAIAGAAAGLIYDRMTAEKKNQPEQPSTAAPDEVKKTETNKQPAKPVPATATPSA